jgi:hypothetical protein
LIIDESDNLFTIASLAATSPNGGENIQVGTTFPVTWSSSNINAVNISYSVDNGTSWIDIVNSYPASSGVYNWGVPNSPTSLGLIRVRDASVPTIEDISNNVFSILLLQLTSPIGGEGWTIGASKNITWNSNGISSIKIEYSTNGGINWDLIQGTHPANTGSYSWTIPNAPSSQVKVKISDASIPAIKDSTAGNFTIGKITLLAPVTGNHWQAGSTKEIQWNATTGINNVKIEYSTNSGSSWNTITNSTNAALGTYSWSIPGTISTTTAQVRVSHSSTGLAIYDTTGLFTISNLQVTSPNGGEYWQAGTNKNITWSSSVSTNIKIDYSTDNGSNWNTIIASTPAVAGTYSWSIPSNLSSSNARIRISDVSNSSIFDVSDNSFKIGSINIIDPVAGNIWQAGTTQQIRWNASSSISNVRIDYSEDDGLNWVNIILSTSAVTGSYNWSIPGSLSSTTTRIRVSDAQSSLNILSISDAFSTMSLSLTSPNGGEKWQAGTSKNITWNASTTISNVKLEYSLDNGSTWTTIIASIAASNGTYAWSIPSGISSNQALIKISDVANSSIFDLSNNTFTINRIQITSPVTADQWQAGTTKNITWSSANINSLKIEYSTNGGTNWISIVSSVAGSLGSYSWDIPSNVTTTQAKIRISDVSDATVNDSSGLFRISILQLTSPNGGEQWQAGTTRTINWTSSNVSNVQLEYTTNNGTNWNTIVASTPAAGGSYNWSIPSNLTTSNARVRVSDAANSSINDFSDNTFTISNLVLTSPVGGEQWQAGTIKNITWSGNASISEVKLEYSLNAGSSWTVIQNAVTASLGTYAWTIPSNISSNQARIRVSSVANPLITNQSADFTISRLELTSPTGGEYWQTGTNKNITWVTGQVTNIKIEYSTNGGSSWTSIINSVAAASGTYSWSIPAGLSTSTAKIKISDVSNSAIKDSTASTFVLGTVAVTSPNGGEEFQAGTTQPITWTVATSVQNVRIDYSTNNGTSWNSIVSSALASAGTYNWSIPTNISSANCLIRISDAASSLQILDVSDNVFSINSLMLLSPNGGEYLQVGITKAIQWSSANITLVKLEYTTNNGTDWNLIANNVTANTLSYNWVIPNTPSNNVKVRISDAGNSAIRDISDSTFTIANVTVLSPNGGERWQSGSTKQITWSNTSNVSLVNLYYSTNNGTSWNSIVLNQTASSGSYNWTVPATPSQQTLVKVVDANSSGAISDSSDAVFTISSLSIVAPIGGENWLGGSTQAIRWTNSSDVNLVDIYYSTNNGTSWTSIVTNQSTVGGQYNWSVPVNINTSTARVKIEYSTDVTITASSGTFSIYYPNLVLTAPNGGEFIQAGLNTNITWNSTIIANVKLDYSLDGGTSWTTIVASHPSTPASYTWLVPDNLSSTNALVRISDASNASVFDVSDFGFKIGWINLTSPNGGENWQSGTTKNITWSNSGSVSNIKIELSTNGGTNWSTITASTPAAAGTYSWVVINSPTDEALIRLSDAASSSAIKDQSTNQFSISSLALVYPAGGNDLQAGSSYNLTWTASTNIENVSLHYSSNNGSTWNTIIASATASAGSYNWTVPANLASNQGLIQVRNAVAPEIRDSSSSNINFKILTITSPTGGENWQIGSNQNITWTSSNIANVKIEYSSNNGGNWSTLVNSIPANAGVYVWTVTGLNTDQAKIRVVDETNNNILSVSEAFTIFQPSLLVNSPNGGENWQSGTVKNITWTANLINNVKIEYSTDNGTVWNTIVSSFSASSGSFNWLIPDSLSSIQALVRVSDAINPLIADLSDNVFTISTLILNAPNGGEYLTAGDTTLIHWYNSAHIANVRLQYSLDGGVNWNNITSSTPSAPGSYTWNIPQIISSAIAKIRISAANVQSIQDTSDGYFKIGWIKVVSPNGFENLQAGKVFPINFLKSTSIPEVRIDYTLNDGLTWINITPSSNVLNNYSWLIPENISTALARIRISDAESNLQITDNSDTVFSISSLKITEPTASSNWGAGTTQTITWENSPDIATLRIEYSQNNGATWDTLSTSVVASAGNYVWNIPSNISSGSSRIRIMNALNNAIAETSDVFNIFVPSISVTYPNGGERIQAGTTKTITWTSSYVTTIKIELTTNNGQSWSTLAPSLPAANGSYDWLISNTLSTNNARIRISDFTNSSITDSSDGVFSVGWLQVTSPNGGENWLAGSTQNITWVNSSSVQTVNIEYFADTTWVSIANSVNATQQFYSWLVPSLSTTTAKIRISDALSNWQISDSSNSVFSISSLTVVSPNGNEFLQAGTTHEIKWTGSSHINTLKIEYSINGGSTWFTITNSANASTGSYNWQIPIGLSADSAFVRISDAANINIFDVSNNSFKIGTLQLVAPNSPEKLLVGSMYRIQWTTSSNIKWVDLHYSTNNGQIWIPITGGLSYPADSSGFNWVVPASASDSCLIRLRNTLDISYTDISNSVFTISRLKIITPNGGQMWQAGITQRITWNSEQVNFLAIEYTINDGTEWKSISPAYPADSGYFDWNIPEDISLVDTNYRVRLRDLASNSIMDTSDNNFTISYIRLLAPNGGGGQQIGTSYVVRWEHSSLTVNNVRLDFTTNNGSTWSNIISSYPADSGYYLWNIPNTPSQNCRVKITDVNNPTIYDMSDSLFVLSSIQLVYPSGGISQKLQVGKTYNITWNSGFIQNVQLEYSFNNGTDWNEIPGAASIPAVNGEFAWTVPSTTSKECRIRVRDVAYANIFDISDTTFTICDLNLTSPNELIAWQVNTTRQITWESVYLDSVRIQLSTDNGNNWLVNVAIVPANLGSYDWNIPNIVTSTAKIRITDKYDLGINDISDTNFVIGKFPKLSMAKSYQKDTIKFVYEAPTPTEVLNLVHFEYEIEGATPIVVTGSLVGDYSNIVGPKTDTLKWFSPNNLTNYEGLVKVKAIFASNLKVNYSLTVDSVGVDNKPPVFDVSKVSTYQNPYTSGWNKIQFNWEAAIDTSRPVKYSLYVSETTVFDSIPILTTQSDTILIPGLKTATPYNLQIRVTDNLGNFTNYTVPFKPAAACDFNSDNRIDAADLAGFVNAWSRPDSLVGADMFPYTDTIPSIKVAGDNKLDVQDLFVFVHMWNYYQLNKSLPKTNSSYAENVERKNIKFKKGINTLSIPVQLEPELELLSYSLEMTYNSANFSFDSLSIFSPVEEKVPFKLTHNDTIKGVFSLDYTDLSGSLNNEYQLNFRFNYLTDVNDLKDSLVILVNAYNKELKKVVTKTIVYSLQEVPSTFTLYQNYPNPFNPSTTIQYELPEKAMVNLVIYDILGQRVATLINEEQVEGYYKVVLDVGKLNYGLASGVYIYRLEAGNFVSAKKMLLLK